MTLHRLLSLTTASLLLTACGPTDGPDILITGGSVLDGTGDAAFPADVGIRGDRIVWVGPAGDA